MQTNIVPLHLLYLKKNDCLFVQYSRIFVRFRSGSDIAWWTA